MTSIGKINRSDIEDLASGQSPLLAKDTVHPPFVETLDAKEKLAQFKNQPPLVRFAANESMLAERKHENTIRVFELVRDYMQGAMPEPPDALDDGEAHP